MMNESFQSLNRKVFAILSKELGIPETIRFYQHLGLGTGDYTQERRELFKDLTMEEYRAHTVGENQNAM